MNFGFFPIAIRFSDHIQVPAPQINDTKYPEFANKKHDEKVRELEEELKKSGRFQQIHTFYQYSANKTCGEVDLLAIGSSPEWYEIKYRYTNSNLAKALLGLNKFRKAYPRFRGRAYYLSCDGVVIEITNFQQLT